MGRQGAAYPEIGCWVARVEDMRSIKARKRVEERSRWRRLAKRNAQRAHLNLGQAFIIPPNSHTSRCKILSLKLIYTLPAQVQSLKSDSKC